MRVEPFTVGDFVHVFNIRLATFDVASVACQRCQDVKNGVNSIFPDYFSQTKKPLKIRSFLVWTRGDLHSLRWVLTPTGYYIPYGPGPTDLL